MKTDFLSSTGNMHVDMTEDLVIKPRVKVFSDDLKLTPIYLWLHRNLDYLEVVHFDVRRFSIGSHINTILLLQCPYTIWYKMTRYLSVGTIQDSILIQY